ncbi:MAG TPA: DUF4038 domain-containing protein [Candidatus Paceibacterota bacterium]|nr:DUF4038 domain-containing protein [Candidatus Paceibacterota bacterium]
MIFGLIVEQENYIVWAQVDTEIPELDEDDEDSDFSQINNTGSVSTDQTSGSRTTTTDSINTGINLPSINTTNACLARGSISKSAGTPRIVARGRCFETIDGRPFYPVADTAWLLGKLTNADIETYIRSRSQQGFNVIKFDSREGDFAKHDFIFDTLKKYNMYAETGPTHGQSNGIAYVNRYKNRDNIFAWIVGGLDERPTPPISSINSLLQSVRSADPGRLVSAHPRTEHLLTTRVGNIPAHNVNANLIDFYSTHKCSPGSIAGLVSADYNRGNKPVYLMEPVYEGRVNDCGCSNGCTATQVSQQINEAISGGVAGISYGHHSIWSFNRATGGGGDAQGGTPWTQAINSTGASSTVAATGGVGGTSAQTGGINNQNQTTSEDAINLFDILTEAGKACVAQFFANQLTGFITTRLNNFVNSLNSSFMGPPAPTVPVSEMGKILAKEIMSDGIAFCMMNGIVESILQSTIAWAKGGFDGDPKFIQNMDAYFKNVTDEVIGQFLDDISGNILCDPWSIEVRLALLLQYERNDKKVCKLSDIVNNINKFVNEDFSEGKWKGWFSLTQDSGGNFFRQTREQAEILDRKIEMKKNNLLIELNWGRGFLPDKSKDPNDDPNKTTTPGTLILHRLETTLGIPAGRMTIADEIDELMSVLINYFLTTGFEKIFGDDEETNFAGQYAKTSLATGTETDRSNPFAAPGDSTQGARGGFLWKPISESNQKLVVLLPSTYNNKISKVCVVQAQIEVECGRYSGIHNGNRTHWRFNKPGSGYGSGVFVVATLNTGQKVHWSIPNGAQRTTY